MEKRFTVRIDGKVYKDFKRYCVDNDTNIQAVFSKFLEDLLYKSKDTEE